MTLKQLHEALGTLVLFKDSKNNWRRAKLVHVFELPTGIPESQVCCLVHAPKFKHIIYARQIYYAFPHFNKKIREFHIKSQSKNRYGYACAAKQYVAD
jgi:hypothetical protein